VDALYALAKTRLPVILKAKLSEFPNALIDTHGKDLTVSGEPSRSSTPHVQGQGDAPGPVSTTTAANKPAPAPKAKAINTETVVVSASFQASADDLFNILTDEKRIPHWSRAPAQVGGSLDPLALRCVRC
jgi:activator of Hsp90 ATPase protein 1